MDDHGIPLDDLLRELDQHLTEGDVWVVASLARRVLAGDWQVSPDGNGIRHGEAVLDVRDVTGDVRDALGGLSTADLARVAGDALDGFHEAASDADVEVATSDPLSR